MTTRSCRPNTHHVYHPAFALADRITVLSNAVRALPYGEDLGPRHSLRALGPRQASRGRMAPPPTGGSADGNQCGHVLSDYGGGSWRCFEWILASLGPAILLLRLLHAPRLPPPPSSPSSSAAAPMPPAASRKTVSRSAAAVSFVHTFPSSSLRCSEWAASSAGGEGPL